MDNKDWIFKYINKLFSIDIAKEGVALRDSKLEYINLPLYKYCYVCEEVSRNDTTVDYNIVNFENDVLFFQNPNKFNDPFDCFLGFSQSQMIRDLLTQEFRRKKQLTPQNRKAIAAIFSDEDVGYSLNTIRSEDLKPFVEAILSLVSEDDLLKSAYKDILEQLFNQGDVAIRKLVTNTMTVKDKQILVDVLYSNPSFIQYIKERCKPENIDFILRAAPRDLKIKIENEPNSFIGDNNGETYGIFDFLHIFAGASNNSELSVDEIDVIKHKFNEFSEEILEKGRKIISEQFRVTCLSERMDSPLMWSHYANKHFGFCLEYDFTTTVTGMRYPDLIPAQLMLLPVCYSEKRPLLSKALFSTKTILAYKKYRQLPPDFLKQLMYGLLIKSEDWAYEKEWRIFRFTGGAPTMRLPKARKVFLGANMEEAARERIIQIAQKKHIPIYQMFLHGDKYKFDFYQVK